jgi:hypothetical protein
MLLEWTLKDKNHKEDEGYNDWLGDDFEPVHFDLKLINKMLNKIGFGCFEF